MGFQYTYEQEHQIRCKHCKRMFKRIIRDTIEVEAEEPPEKDSPDP